MARLGMRLDTTRTRPEEPDRPAFYPHGTRPRNPQRRPYLFRDEGMGCAVAMIGLKNAGHADLGRDDEPDRPTGNGRLRRTRRVSRPRARTPRRVDGRRTAHSHGVPQDDPSSPSKPPTPASRANIIRANGDGSRPRTRSPRRSPHTLNRHLYPLFNSSSGVLCPPPLCWRCVVI